MLLPAPNQDANERRNEKWLISKADSDLVKDILNTGLMNALQQGQDIYLQLRGNSSVLIYDGVERNEEKIPHKVVAPLIARLKIMADLDIKTTHARQEGAFTLNIAGAPFEVSVVFEPMLLGEEFSLQLIRKPEIS